MKFDLVELLKAFENIGSLYAVVKDLYSGKFFPLPGVIAAEVDAGLLRNVDECSTPPTKAIYTMSFVLTNDGRRKCNLPVYEPPPPPPPDPPKAPAKAKKTEKPLTLKLPPPRFNFD